MPYFVLFNHDTPFKLGIITCILEIMYASLQEFNWHAQGSQSQ